MKLRIDMQSPAEIKPEISFETFEQIDIRVGTILEVCDIPESKKLVKLRVDLGEAVRNVVVGMKLERKNPKEIEGLQALFVVNLAPRKIAGILSEAMLFDIGYADNLTPVLAIPEKPVSNGTRAG
ncbi:MAG: tRNA-binding protein [Pseudomonadota bacterium]